MYKLSYKVNYLTKKKNIKNIYIIYILFYLNMKLLCNIWFLNWGQNEQINTDLALPKENITFSFLTQSKKIVFLLSFNTGKDDIKYFNSFFGNLFR